MEDYRACETTRPALTKWPANGADFGFYLKTGWRAALLLPIPRKTTWSSSGLPGKQMTQSKPGYDRDARIKRAATQQVRLRSGATTGRCA